VTAAENGWRIRRDHRSGKIHTDSSARILRVARESPASAKALARQARTNGNKNPRHAVFVDTLFASLAKDSSKEISK